MVISNTIISLIRRIKVIAQQEYKLVAVFCVFVFLIVLGTMIFFNRPPSGFPAETVFTILPGTSIREISENLKSKGFISSSFLFKKVVILQGKQKGVIAGDYFFPNKFSVWEVARRVTRGTFGMMPAKVTIPEGFTVADIAGQFPSSKFYKFDKTEFMMLAASKEGYLFPDTYFFMPSATAAEVVKTLLNNFETKLATLQADFASSTRSSSDILNVASILEKEAASTSDRLLISGIIWQRLKIGMPLQIDATLGYVLNKGTFQLTVSDLNLDSPYNTYEYKGLPPTPIANPGLDSINAALHPTSTKYLYYLSDKSGKIYYAATFEEHKKNRELYLGK